MIDGADDHLAGRHPGALILGMTLQTEVEVAFDEQLGVDGSVGHMTSRATFAQRVVLVDVRLGLAFSVFAAITLGALGWVRGFGTADWGRDRQESSHVELLFMFQRIAARTIARNS